jgi:hypothetical protein
MGRHLPSARSGIGRRAGSLQQHLFRRHAEYQAERAIAVIRIKPVVPWPQNQSGRRLDGLMSGPADLKEDFVLPFEQDFAVV